MDLGRSFAYPFRDPAWFPRLAVGALLELLPFLFALPLLFGALEGHTPIPRLVVVLLIPALLGLACRWAQLGYLRRLAAAVLGDPGARLPAWDRFEQDLAEGFKLWLVSVALFLPALGTAAIVAFLAMVVEVPALFWALLVLLVAPLALVVVIYLPAALITAVARHDLAAAFDLGAVWALISHRGGTYVLAFVVAIAAEVLAQFGAMACCVGIFLTRFAAHCVSVHAFCCAYRAMASEPPPTDASAGLAAGGL